MPQDEFSLRDFTRGTVTAPAGCGKTHLIGEALKLHAEPKAVLVLTHTNAGVAALRDRLNRAGVVPRAYRLSTIDGWAMRLISAFPKRSGHSPDLLRLANPPRDYRAIRIAARALVEAGHVDDILDASYARLIVDEYQDCSLDQHGIVVQAAKVLPTCVLGDPMQAIFGFGQNRLVHWDRDVLAAFPAVRTLDVPWRWINAGAGALGAWLLCVRDQLAKGKPVDLGSAPPAVKWAGLDGSPTDHHTRLMAGRQRCPVPRGRVLIIGDSKNPASQHTFASHTPGAVAVESVDLKDLVAFAETFDLTAPDALGEVLEFAQRVMTNVDAKALLRRVDSLTRGRARTAASDVEKAALAFTQAPSYRGASDLLLELRQSANQVHRPTVLNACVSALATCEGPVAPSFRDAALHAREQNRHMGRPLPRRAVGSTLLLKGLEAEAVVVLNADDLDRQNLYVAMTRGSHALTVCSRAALLKPAA